MAQVVSHSWIRVSRQGFLDYLSAVVAVLINILPIHAASCALPAAGTVGGEVVAAAAAADFGFDSTFVPEDFEVGASMRSHGSFDV